MPKAESVRTMFAGIAQRYDRANHLLSFGIDYRWRKKLIDLVAREQPQTAVDLATGSGDVAFALADRLPPSTQIQGLDFCQPMLDQAELKKNRKNSYHKLTFAIGDCQQLPLADNSVDVLTISFGFRNLENRSLGLREMLRVLRPGGSLFILEFTQPYRWVRPFYYFYLKTLLPLLAKLSTGNQSAYQYLVGSIESFPTRQAIAQEMKNNGFTQIQHQGLTLSTVAIHQGKKL